MKQHRLAQFLSTILMVCLIPVAPVEARETTVKVAFIPDEGFFNIETNGDYSGYNYEFLLEIDQHTDWEFEYVIIDEGSKKDSYLLAGEMIQAGEVDIMGTVHLTEYFAEQYEFCEEFYGVARTTICALSNSTTLVRDNYFDLDTIHAAIVKDSPIKEAHFFQIMESYGVEPQVTYVDDYEESMELLLKEEVDVIMSSDIESRRENLVTLSFQNPSPFYFVSTKGNTELVAEIDEAIRKIKSYDPTLSERLQNRYFEKELAGDYVRSALENKALEEYDYLNVGLVRNVKPYLFDETEENQGISKEMLDLLSEIIDVEFRYVWVDSYGELTEKIESGEVHLSGAVPYDYDLSQTMDVTLSRAFFSSGAVSVVREDDGMEDTEYHRYFIYGGVPDIPSEQVELCNDVDSLLEEISKNGGKTLFCDQNIAQYTIQKLGLDNLEIQNATDLNSYMAIGLSNQLDPVILGLINHGILRLDPNKVDEIVYRNVIVNDGVSFATVLDEYAVYIYGFIILSLVSFSSVVVQQGKKFKLLSQQDRMTKLYNAGHFREYAEKTTQNLDSGCLILIDIDYFKQVNDTYGHQKGDEVIQVVAQAVKSHFRQGDMVARLGGDEFVVLLENPCKSEDLERKFRHLLDSLEENPTEIPVSLSIGGYIFNEPIKYKELYDLADKNLYKVKENGRNGFSFSS
ncbi:MAG: GGDEF domain-containing protein [Eubacteriales bacterium]